MPRTTIVFAAFIVASAVAAVSLFDSTNGGMPAFAAVTQQSDSAKSTQSAILNQSVQKGDTLIRMLKSAGVTPKNATAAARALAKLFDPRKLRVGQRMMLRFGPDDGESSQLSIFSIELGKNKYVEVTRGADGKYRARRSSQPWSPGNTAGGQENNGLITLKARSGDTIGNMMRALNIHKRDIDRAVKALRTRYDPKNLRVGQKISILPGTFDAKQRLALLGVVVHLEKGVVEVRRGANHSYSARRLSAMTLGDENSAVAVLETTPQALAGERQKLRIPKGATLMKMLTARGVSHSQADRAIRALKMNFDPRRLRAGNHIYVIVTEGDGGKKLLQGLSIAISAKRHVTVMRGESGKFSSGLAREPINSLANIAPAAKTPATTPASSAPQTKIVQLPEVVEVAPEKPVHKAPQAAVSTPAAASKSDPYVNAVTIRVERGDTLMAILRSEGIDRNEADGAIRALRKLFNPRRLRENQQIVVATTADGSGATLLEGFSIKIGDGRHIEVRRGTDKKFSVAKVPEPNFVERAMAANSNEAGDTRPVRENIKLTPQPGQGQAMKGAMIAAAAPAEQGLVAHAATAWPAETVAADEADNALKFPTPQEKQTAEDGRFRKAVMIGKGDTLFVALTKAGSAAGDAEAAIAAFRKVHNPRSLQIGQTLTLAFEPLVAEDKADAFRLAEIALDVAPDRDILVARQSDDSFQASEMARDLVRRLEKAEGRIQTSLYDAATKAGLPINILMEMVQIFSFDVDFQREIQKNDHFEVLYENLLNDKGETVALGPVLFASLSLSGKVIGLYRHEPSNGPVDYFNIKGQSARKALMRTPINGARLSSGFGMRRHPVLGYNKMHRGLDFSAPRGTPIVAAGDGVIEVAGRNGSYGKYIRIRHNSTYKTAYAHMKGFARGMRSGKRVRQGQTIGYVGTTGRSTGPHLHYEVLRSGKRMNPRRLKLPTGQKLAGAELALFEGQVRKVRVLIAEVPSVQKVASR
ncbi:MAG: peptidoglycan DD-metalloendopeptidase family protein [Rhodospirillaceae bacterium]|nr:peptidoglycan DD-metalloendopeptidase family protein [Rhodospirillaceae bacterium]